jgi:hypothetical protein
MWPSLLLGTFGAWTVGLTWRKATDGERLLLLWTAIGSLELVLHDVGNERRFVFLIPALVALSTLVLVRGRLLPPDASRVERARLILFAPLVFYVAYVIAGPLARLLFLSEVRNHELRWAVRLAAALGAVLGTAVLITWPRVRSALPRPGWQLSAASVFVGLAVAWNLFQFGQWAAGRTYKNYEASIALGRALPPETLVQGKLANGLSLENRIRPIFIGHEFGNYADRKQRDDVRYILTYTVPWIGYEGSQITDVLAAYRSWRIIMTFDVAETPEGHDTAALIEKRARH